MGRHIWLGLWCFAACGGHADEPSAGRDTQAAGPGQEASPVAATPPQQHERLVQCSHADALCPSVLDDGKARETCAPGRSVHIGACSPFSVLYVREGIDTGERCYYDDSRELVAAVRYANTLQTCAFGPVSFVPPACPSDTISSNDLCRAPSIE
jgi:hypothetical protein